MDSFDRLKVEETVAFMRRLGIRRLGDIELGPTPEAAPVAASPQDVADLDKGPPEGDDALYWSVSGPLPSEARSADKPPEE